MVGTRLDDLEHHPSAPPALRGLSRPERVIGVAAVLLAAGLLAIIIGLFGLVGQRADAVSAIDNAREARLAVYGLMQASIDAETGQRGYLLTGDGEYLARYERGRADAFGELARLEAAAERRPELASDVRRAQRLAQTAFADLAASLQQGASGDALRNGVITSNVSMNALRVQGRTLLADIEQILDAIQDAEKRTTNTLYALGAALAVLALIALAVTFWALYGERKSWRATFGTLSAAREAAEHGRAQATASDLAKTRFLAVASHDMRQPLHALTLYISALERRVENPEARDILAKMERATDSMIAMFATLLDLARIQAGAIDPEISDFALQDVFDRLAAENPGGEVQVIPTALRVRSDPVLLERALRNLVANALKHGGGRAELSARDSGNRADIVVADHGPGISADDQERIFEEFVRLQPRGQGLGLGLAIVRGIAQALDIPLELKSAPGRGSRFILRPALAAQGSAADAVPPAAPDLSGVRVLVVDDEPLAREAIAGALTDIGAEVRTAANETEAFGAVEHFIPHLLVMDLRIDGEIRGLDIAQRLRERLSPAPNMIVVTGDTGPETLALLQTAEADWLIKPVNPRQLGQLAAQVARA